MAGGCGVNAFVARSHSVSQYLTHLGIKSHANWWMWWWIHGHVHQSSPLLILIDSTGGGFRSISMLNINYYNRLALTDEHSSSVVDLLLSFSSSPSLCVSFLITDNIRGCKHRKWQLPIQSMTWPSPKPSVPPHARGDFSHHTTMYS